jgi:hypothetical protein
VVAAGAVAMVAPIDSEPIDRLIVGAIAYALSATLLNSRAGRDVEEIVTDRTVRSLHWVGREFLPGVYRIVMDAFSNVVSWIERGIYAIDELFRFRADQRRLGLALRCLVLPVWTFLAYVTRFAVNLVAEPQLNPIKHFPIVTVAHKVLIPVVMSSGTRQLLMGPPLGLGSQVTYIVQGALQLILPGIAGFLAWELTSNWRLYRANRPRSLTSVPVGSHGERIRRLLTPGFHSGTVPKLFRQLRRAELETRPDEAARRTPFEKYLGRLHHVESDVRRFLDREFLALLRRSETLSGLRLEIDTVRFGVNRLEIVFRAEGRSGARFGLAIDDQSRWLVGSVSETELLAHLSPAEREALRNAVAGLYKLSGVDLVREQIEPSLRPPGSPYDITDEGLVIWPRADFAEQLVYPLEVRPEVLRVDDEPGPVLATGPSLSAGVLAAGQDVPWERWVRIWEADRSAPARPEEALPGVRLLPDEPMRS